MHVEMKCIPFVEPAPPKSIEGLEAKDVMHSPVVSTELIPTVHSVIHMMQSCR